MAINTPRVRSPELPQHFPWLNAERPIRLQELRGRVVILDFWTYGCINCLHELPMLKSLQQKYRDGLTVIGVHSAKFDHETNAEQVYQAMLRYEITYPVVVDQNLAIWQSYAVRAWPTHMVIDPAGYCVGLAVGEGHGELLDEMVGDLLQISSGASGNIISPAVRTESRTRLTSLSLPATPLRYPGKVLAAHRQGCDKLYISDTGHHRLVVSNLQGKEHFVVGSGIRGFRDGSFEEAQFAHPQGLALSADSQVLYVCDTENHRLRQIDFSHRVVTTLAGTGQQGHGGFVRAEGRSVALNSPWDMTLIGEALYIAVAGTHQIWKYELNTGYLETFAGTGSESCFNGSRQEAVFAQPSGITRIGQTLFVTDAESSTIRAIGVLDNKVWTVCGSEALFGFGDRDGSGTQVLLQHPLGISHDTEGFLWLTDTYNHKIKRIEPRTGACICFAGEGSPGLRDGITDQAQFHEPSGLSYLQNKLFIADTNNHVIRCLPLRKKEVSTLRIEGLCAPGICTP
jgi:thiol-disulfide isomerase/thioredoxin